jgi:hypothetical protein
MTGLKNINARGEGETSCSHPSSIRSVPERRPKEKHHNFALRARGREGRERESATPRWSEHTTAPWQQLEARQGRGILAT